MSNVKDVRLATTLLLLLLFFFFLFVCLFVFVFVFSLLGARPAIHAVSHVDHKKVALVNLLGSGRRSSAINKNVNSFRKANNVVITIAVH